jgi:hypothetical protein
MGYFKTRSTHRIDGGETPDPIARSGIKYEQETGRTCHRRRQGS